MSLPVPRAPDTNCDLCTAVWDALDAILTTLRDHDQTDQPHILASICAWWVANSLELYQDDVAALVAVFADALQSQGFDLHRLPNRPRRTTRKPDHVIH